MSLLETMRVPVLLMLTVTAALAFGCGGDDCEPSDEVANFLDDDCDGEIDNGFKYVFLTSSLHTGDLTASSPIMTLDGLEAADAICQDLAEAADLPGTYAAWLSSEMVSVASSLPFDAANGDSYVLVDGTEIAVGFDDVIDGGIDAAIQLDEAGNVIPPAGVDSFVWTGSFAAGTPQSGQVCNDWTDGTNGAPGVIGEYLATNELWSRISARTCDNLFRLYCFQR